MIRALLPIAPMVGNLIRRLATNHDGEIFACVRALRRVLASAGLDLNDHAAAIHREPDEGEGDPGLVWHQQRAFCLSTPITSRRRNLAF
jgi:hypothetical protein